MQQENKNKIKTGLVKVTKIICLKGQVANFEVDVRWPSTPKKLPVTLFESLYLSKKGEKRKKSTIGIMF